MVDKYKKIRYNLREKAILLFFSKSRKEVLRRGLADLESLFFMSDNEVDLLLISDTSLEDEDCALYETWRS